jgi:hypothetical protein
MKETRIMDNLEAAKALTPREVAEVWFKSLEQNRIQDAQQLLDEGVVWENVPPTPGVATVRHGCGLIAASQRL